MMPTHHPSFRERFNISRYAIQYPWLTLSFWIAVLVAGTLAFTSLKYALFPDVTFPVVVVNATAPLTTALNTEANLTQPIEQHLQSLKNQGLANIRSSTLAGRTILNVSFAEGTNLDTSTRQVETTLKQVVLPVGSTYNVIPVNLNESAAISYAIQSSQQTLPQLTDLTQNQIVPAIAQLAGVLKVNVLGVPAEIPIKSSLPTNEVIQPPGTSVVRFSGQDALAVEVVKRSDANTLEVVRDVERVVQQLRSTLPNVQLNLAATQADYIQEATQVTIEALTLAIALSIVVIFPFLWNWKATLISALAIPTSLLGTFIVMAIWGFNLETITLLALALVIGIIVDDAIVDVENIARHIEAGESPRQAAIHATTEIGLTVTAATFTIVAVFLPVGLMQGVLGQFFRPFGITVSAAVITSLLVARTLSPLLAVYWLRSRTNHAPNQHWFRFAQGYQQLLQWSLLHRWIVLGIALLSFVVGVSLIPFIPQGFIPKLDRGEFTINYTIAFPAFENSAFLKGAKQPARINRSVDVAKQLETVVLKSPQVRSVLTTVGTHEGQPNQGTLYLELHHDRTISTAALQDQLRQQLPSIPNVTTSIEDIPFIETASQKPFQIALVGDDPFVLTQTAKTIQSRMATIPGLRDIAITGEANTSNQIVELDRLNSRRVAYISADLGQGVALGTVTNQVVEIANQVMPANVSIVLGSDAEKMREVFDSFGMTLALSILCIFIVLVLLFRSWTEPFVILFSLPLSIVGALISTLLAHSDFGMISVIGIIFLLGLTNKNAILLVDQINQLRRLGLSRTKAILQAGPIRLRPILMTTAATILGMLPIALGLGAGAELRAPMAIAIIGGLIASTLLSLIVIPVIYTLLDDPVNGLRDMIAAKQD